MTTGRINQVADPVTAIASGRGVAAPPAERPDRDLSFAFRGSALPLQEGLPAPPGGGRRAGRSFARETGVGRGRNLPVRRD